MNIEARKIEIVKQILSINNEILIKELEAKLIQLLPKSQANSDNKKKSLTNRQEKSTPPITEIRKNISLDEIVAEQQITPITYAEVRAMTKKITWKHSLAELLEALK